IFVFSMSLSPSKTGVVYKKHIAATAATKSLPLAVPDATLFILLYCTDRRIACCSASSATPSTSFAKRFQSSLQSDNSSARPYFNSGLTTSAHYCFVECFQFLIRVHRQLIVEHPQVPAEAIERLYLIISF